MVNVLLLIGVILLRFHPAFSNLTVTPTDTVVLAGDSTALGCNSSGGIFTWSHKELEAKGSPKHFYRNKRINHQYEKFGFSVVTNQELGERNLAIENVTTDLAGKYECVEVEDEEERKPAELIVLKNLPECSAAVVESISPNDCNKYSDEILLSCRVKYRGNKSPDLVWRKSGESVALNSKCTIESGPEKICSVTVQPGLDLNRPSFVCQTTGRAAQQQYNCTTQPITTLRSFIGEEFQRTTVSKGDKVVCTSNSRFSCTYEWVLYERVEYDLSIPVTIESTRNVLIAKKIGLHRCEAQCKLRNQTCRIFSQYIEVVQSQQNLTNIEDPSALIHQLLEKEAAQWTPSVIGLLILGVLPYAAFGCYFLTRMRRKRTHARSRIPTSEYHSQAEV